MVSEIELKITKDEALALCDFFARFAEEDDFTLRHTGEYLAFQKIAAQLDRILIEPFDTDYRSLVMAVKERLADGYEGPAPGVVYE